MTELERFNTTSLDLTLLATSDRNHARRRYVATVLTKAFLQELVVVRGFSAHFIANQVLAKRGYTITAGSLIARCRKYGIKTASCREQANNPLVQQAKRETYFQHFGAPHHLCRGTSVYKKRNRTVRRKYGVSNVFQLAEVKIKTKRTMARKYGVTNPVYLPNFKRNCGRRSKVHQKVEQYLQAQGIAFESEVSHRFLKFNRALQRDYCPQPDILIEKKKVIVEVYGDRWHGNRHLYDLTDVIPSWDGHWTVAEIHNFDCIRKRHLESFGYKVIVLWERDINRHFETVKRRLTAALT